jgi:hypothetical protein
LRPNSPLRFGPNPLRAPAGSVWQALHVANACAPAFCGGSAARSGNVVNPSTQSVAAAGSTTNKDFIILSGLATIGSAI